MRFFVPLFVFLAVAAFHSALSASLESAEKEEAEERKDGLTKLQEIDQVEFEAAQKNEAAQLNVTEEQSEDTRYEAAQDGSVEGRVEVDKDITAGGGASSDAAARGGSTESSQSSESSEEAEGRKKREHHESETVSSSDEGSHDSTKEEGENSCTTETHTSAQPFQP